MSLESQIDVQDLDHLGIIAGIIDDIGIVEIIDRELGKHPQEKVSGKNFIIFINSFDISSICIMHIRKVSVEEQRHKVGSQ